MTARPSAFRVASFQNDKSRERTVETQKANHPGLREKQGWLRPRAGFDRFAMMTIPPGSSDERSGGPSMAARQASPLPEPRRIERAVPKT
jgi:hypothetical protein